MRFLRFVTLLFFAPAVLAQSTDLKVSLSLPPTAFGGTYGTWVRGTLTITNAGNVPAQDVVVDMSDALRLTKNPYPVMVFTSASRFEVPSVVPGTTTVEVDAVWPSTPPGAVETTSVAISSIYTDDPDLTNNTSTATTTIVWQSDLRFDSLNVPSSVAAGKVAAITASYSDHGPSPATDKSLTISIPPGARYEGYYASSWFDCAEPPLGGHGDLVCKPYDNDAANDSLEALVSVDPSLAPGTVLTLNGTLTSTSAPQSTASGSLTVTPPTEADAITVTATLDPPTPPVSFAAFETFTVSNTGTQDAEIVTLDVRLPGTGMSPYATWTNASCTKFPLHCTVATLAPGAKMTLSVPFMTWHVGDSSTAVVTWLHGGIVVTSTDFTEPPKPARRRAAHH